MVDGEILFEWNTGDPILLQHDDKQMIPPSNQTTNEEPKVNVGDDFIVFVNKEGDIIE